MPLVDLSMIGIEAQQAYATKLATLAQGKHSEALAKEKDLENQETEQLNALNEQLSQKLRDRAAGKRDPSESPMGSTDAQSLASLAEVPEQVGEFYSLNGFPGKGAEYFKDAATIRKQEADIESGKITDRTHQLDNIIKLADVTSRFLGTARSQEEYTAGLDEIEKMGIAPPETIAQLRNSPWTQDVSAILNEHAMSAKDRATLELNQQTQESLETNRARLAANAERRTTLAIEAQRQAERERAAKRKAEGTKAIEVQPKDVEMAGHALDKVFGEAGVPEDASDYIAGQARKIITRDQTGTLTMPVAIQRAIAQARMDGIITTDKDEGVSFMGTTWGASEETKFNLEPGSTPELAIPLPSNPKEIKAGMHYITPSGIVLAQ